MWILFSVLSMGALTLAEIVGKKAVSTDKTAPLKMKILVMIINMILGLLLYLFGFGESGIAPWILLLKHPMVLAATCCSVVSNYLYLYSLRYIGMTLMAAISSLCGVFIFIGLMIIHTISGEFNSVREMLNPSRFIFIGILLVFTFLLPNVEATGEKRIVRSDVKTERLFIFAGFLFSLAAVILDAGDSLITDFMLDADKIGAADCIITIFFSYIFILPVFCIILYYKNKGTESTDKIINRYSIRYAVYFDLSILFWILTVAIDAVRSEIMFLTYPVISIIGAKVILKEKYTWRQSACVWIIVVAAVAFCITDYQ